MDKDLTRLRDALQLYIDKWHKGVKELPTTDELNDLGEDEHELD